MKYAIVAVRDLAVEGFHRPFFVNHTAQAVRSFQDEVNNAESEIARHINDYELWDLGTFEDESGTINNNPVRIVRAIDLKKEA